MKLVIVGSLEELGATAARFIAAQILAKPDSVLGLPTGETPRGMYRCLVGHCQEGLVSFGEVTTFNLDEFCGIPPDHPASYHRYMEENFLSLVDLPRSRARIPDGMARNPEEEAQRYERTIAAHGGLDLVVLGLGPNGHIAFNEPAHEWGLPTRVVELAPDTRRREARRFGGMKHVPTHAITMGIGTIMRARKVLLLVAGEEKAAVLREAVVGPVTPTLPASVLQLHPDATLILPRKFAAGLGGTEGGAP